MIYSIIIRRCQMNNGFNPDLLSEMILKAIGHRTHKAFAEETGLATAHLSRIIHKKYTYPPRKTTLVQIAKHSEGRVTEQMLFTACGYETSSLAEENVEPKLPAESVRKFMEATLLSALSGTSASWSVIKNAENIFDLDIRINDEPQMNWKFIFLIPDKEGSVESAYSKAIASLVFLQESAGVKFSLVTDSPDAFDRHAFTATDHIDMDISFILVDHDNLLVSKENWISRSKPLNAYMEKINLLK